jgi:hypothetical protein
MHGSPACGGPHVPGWFRPPSETTTRLRQVSSGLWQYRVLLQACPVATGVLGWQVRSTSSHNNPVAQPPKLEGSHACPCNAGGVHRLLRHGAVETQSLVDTQALPAGSRGPHTPAAQRRASSHSEVLAQGAPVALRARQTRALSQYASGTQRELGQLWPAVGSGTHWFDVQVALVPQSNDEEHGVPGVGSG